MEEPEIIDDSSASPEKEEVNPIEKAILKNMKVKKQKQRGKKPNANFVESSIE